MADQYDERLLKARQDLFIALDQIQYGGSQLEVVNRIEELGLALLSLAFARHPVTRTALNDPPTPTATPLESNTGSASRETPPGSEG